MRTDLLEAGGAPLAMHELYGGTAGCGCARPFGTSGADRQSVEVAAYVVGELFGLSAERVLAIVYRKRRRAGGHRGG